MHARGIRALGISALLIFFGSLCVTPAGRSVTVSALPARLSDQEFWHLIADFSEPDGFFRSDNLVSNESTFQRVIPELHERTRRGGVYLGVGPDQNFTYIAAIHPRIAFIVDIRRQNLMLHLMYKAIIEQTDNRVEFVSTLFSRPRPRPHDVPPSAPPETIFAAFKSTQADERLYAQNLKAITTRLLDHHKLPLTRQDLRSLEYVYRAFYTSGPDLRYSFPRGPWFAGFPTYAELMIETDATGAKHSYLADEEHYRALRDLERRNLVVPVVGDFAGTKALRSIAEYLRQHAATVAVFYTSNVEQYLFQGPGWRRFFGNVAALPLDEKSLFIRAYFNNMGYRYQLTSSTFRSATLLDSIGDEVA